MRNGAAPRRLWLWAVMLVGALAIVAAANPSSLSLENNAVRDFGGRRNGPLAVAFFSGDMGFHFGMSGDLAERLAATGLPVIGFSSPKYFGQHRSRAEAGRIVADGLRLTLARTGARRVVLVGQSYGADIVATAASALPPDLRARLAAVAMVVPAQSVYFRADPLGFAYRGTPDARPLDTIGEIGARRLVCIYGLEEEDSLCPPLVALGAHVAGLPGGHYMHHDSSRVGDTLLALLRASLHDDHAAGAGKGNMM
ncbi:AcvB/VirJ family lysyl-phosphatidylglycerol hydrolase [Sphingobium mellinum]|uniref:AcvB/VirJ family lysyl-phosphatidylglycerol hydrolase n=1 Tax=Sphingobium mellinum TaxID=1387166 RepID=UPI0030ED7429